MPPRPLNIGVNKMTFEKELEIVLSEIECYYPLVNMGFQLHIRSSNIEKMIYELTKIYYGVGIVDEIDDSTVIAVIHKKKSIEYLKGYNK